jgi:hypothetical protein
MIKAIDTHYVLSSAGMHFLNKHVEKYAEELL